MVGGTWCRKSLRASDVIGIYRAENWDAIFNPFLISIFDFTPHSPLFYLSLWSSIFFYRLILAKLIKHGGRFIRSDGDKGIVFVRIQLRAEHRDRIASFLRGWEKSDERISKKKGEEKEEKIRKRLDRFGNNARLISSRPIISQW